MPPKKKQKKVQKVQEHHEIINITNQLVRLNDMVCKVSLVAKDGDSYLCHYDGGTSSSHDTWAHAKYIVGMQKELFVETGPLNKLMLGQLERHFKKEFPNHLN